jgi:hypothetical protein
VETPWSRLLACSFALLALASEAAQSVPTVAVPTVGVEPPCASAAVASPISIRYDPHSFTPELRSCESTKIPMTRGDDSILDSVVCASRAIPRLLDFPACSSESTCRVRLKLSGMVSRTSPAPTCCILRLEVRAETGWWQWHVFGAGRQRSWTHSSV